MDTIDGYQRAALSLSQLPSVDQAWILEQLDERDRANVSAALQTISFSAETAPLEDETDELLEPADVSADESSVNIIERADLAALTSVLRQQPDWVTAIVLAWSKSSALREFTDQALPDWTEQIKQARETKRIVREIVLQGVADQLRRNALAQAGDRDFESTLATVNRE